MLLRFFVIFDITKIYFMKKILISIVVVLVLGISNASAKFITNPIATVEMQLTTHTFYKVYLNGLEDWVGVPTEVRDKCLSLVTPMYGSTVYHWSLTCRDWWMNSYVVSGYPHKYNQFFLPDGTEVRDPSSTFYISCPYIGSM